MTTAPEPVDPARAAAVRACLDQVMEPELDAAVTEPGFVTAVRTDACAEFDGALCRGLPAERYGEAQPQPIRFMPRATAAAH